MAELLILVVIAGVVLLYAVDRVRKLRARARQMSGMNERLDVAAAKVDAQQERKQARVRASAELTSVLPAIGRPPLTLPGVPGSAAGPAGEPAAPEPDAGPAGERAASHAPAADDTPAAAEARNIPDAGAEESAAAQAAPDQAGSPRAGDSPDAGDSPAAGDKPGTAGEVAPGPARTPESTLAMGQVMPHATATPRLQVTSDGTMIMPPVPDQAPPPADGATRPPAFSRPRPRTSRPRPASPGPASPGPAGPGPASPMLASPGPASLVPASPVPPGRAQARSSPAGTSYTCAGNSPAFPRRVLASD